MTLNPSVKHHTIIAVLISIWGFLFAFFSRPFEHGEMDLQKWVYVSVGFSLFSFLSYYAISWGQKWIFKKVKHWNVYWEISMYVLYYVLYAVTTYIYYKSDIIRGFYNFPEFLSEIIFNIFLILTPIIFIARRYALKLIPIKEDTIVIKGENKLDVLQIQQSDLVCISNAQNYVEIFFLENEQLQTKLIRSSLKKINTDFEFLIQVHRSHLINPTHFKSWKDSQTILLTQMELPVSKSYKDRLLAL